MAGIPLPFQIVESWADVQANFEAISDTIAGAWTAWTPTVTANSGAITSYTATGQYQNVNSGLGAFQLSVLLTNIGTASSDMHISLPSNFTGAGFSDCIMRETVVGGSWAFAYYGGGGSYVDMYSTNNNGATIWVNNYRWQGLILIPGTWS